MKLNFVLSFILMSLIFGSNGPHNRNILSSFNSFNIQFTNEDEYSNPAEAAQFLKKQIDYSAKDESQSIKFKHDNYFYAKITQKTSGFMGSSTTESKGFYPAHINTGSSEIDVSGDVIYLIYNTNNRKPLIQKFEKGAIQGYSDKLKIMCDDIQEARDIKSALKYLIAEAQPEELSLSTTSQSIQWLTDNVGKVEASNTTYKQSLTFNQEDDNKLTLTVKEIGTNNTTNKRYEHYLADLVAERLEVKVGGGMFGSGLGGSILQLRIFTKRDRDVITYYEDGEREGFENKSAISFNDPLRALRAKKALYKALKHSKGKDADYSGSSKSKSNTSSEKRKETQEDDPEEEKEKTSSNSSDQIERPDMDYKQIDPPKPDYYKVPMIYDVENDELISLERDTRNVSTRQSGFSSGEKLAYVEGTRSPKRFDNDGKYILLFLLESVRQDPRSVIMLYKYQVNKNRDQREYIVTKGNAFGGAKTNKESESLEFTKLGDGFYAMEFKPEPGEYFFSMKDDKTFFSFGVDP